MTVLVSSSSASIYCIAVNAALVQQSDRLKCRYELGQKEIIFVNSENNYQICQSNQIKVDISQVSQDPVFNMVSTQQMPLNIAKAKLLTGQAIDESNFTSIDNPRISQVNNEPPQLEGQPSDLSPPDQKPIEQLLEPPINYNQRLERLRRRLQKTTQPDSQAQSRPELGLRIRARVLPPPIEQPPLPPVEQPVPEFKPIGSLQAYVGYFQSDNIFSSDISPTNDGLFFYGLRLASAYFPIGAKTYINASIDGNLIRYVDQSKFNYNQLLFNVGIYQQLSKRMYGEIGWTNQQLFYARNSEFFQAGDRFLNENSLYLSLGRRDTLTDKLMFDSFYEFNWKLSDPENRSRIVNSLWLSLSYYLQKPLQVGLNYQLYLSDFSARDRQDQYHRLYGSIIYRLSNSTSLNFQTGYSFGDSTARNIDFESWFLNISYNLKIGEF
ncbi:transporter family protein [Anabaena azotica]|uniref:hypothetical protein n=1 Tax=Anabaena azotica TaxID=197653 RepID=UPI0028C4B6EE|nr:hypothetical protein [Anabaena azotica]